MSLALLFPPTCVACRGLMDSPSATELCEPCSRGHAPLPPQLGRAPCGDDPIDALFDYDGPLGPVLTQFKFNGELSLAGPLGHLLSEHPRLCTTPRGEPWDALVPVPLHSTRLWSRGYNQSLILGRWAVWHAQRQGLRAPKVRPEVLRRVRATPPQSQLDAANRQTNLHGAFEVPSALRHAIEGRKILVLDDVTTTGATFSACFHALHHAGAAVVHGLALLRTLS